ncbi:MAG: lipoyl(octanoyl) transferase LipB [Candidatus Thermoplasmatota archaeon]|nr:lipoyl(octanoyl) transferase LipB [Candidatus Thermoplasmatota archaeon]
MLITRVLLERNSDYAETLSLQRSLRDRVNSVSGEAYILAVEHKPVYSAGRHSDPADLVDRSVSVFEVERGGSYTFHGPGQVVVYAIVNLRSLGTNIREFVSSVQEAEVSLLRHYGILAESRTGKDAGVWVSGRKISSTGFSLKEFSTMHGIALNVSTDLSAFHKIRPCGFSGDVMTSMENELQRAIPYEEVRRKLLARILGIMDSSEVRIFYEKEGMRRQCLPNAQQ